VSAGFGGPIKWAAIEENRTADLWATVHAINFFAERPTL
jgi:hypothetical protein